MAQSRVVDYPGWRASKPFAPMADPPGANKRRAGGDLRSAVLAQEAAKRQCSGVSGVSDAPGGHHQGGAPTDFAGFFQQLQQSGQLQRDEDAAQQQLEQQQQGTSSLDQLLKAHAFHSKPVPKLELDSMISLDRSRDSFLQCQQPATSSNVAGSAPAERWHLQGLSCSPWDWSLKCRVRLASPAPFAVLEARVPGGLGPSCAAVAGAGGLQQQEQAAGALSHQERLEQALLQWQHPAVSLPGHMLAALRAAEQEVPPAGAAASWVASAAAASEPPGSRPLESRVAAWRDALRSAYSALRRRHCPLLYVCGQAFRQPFVAVLCAPGVLGCSSLHAVVSRSNRQLRAHLASYGAQGVLAGSMEAQQDGRAALQQQQQQQQAPAAAWDGQPGSQLLLAGAAQVHALYAALQALPWCGEQQADVPLLSAPVQFLHAQLARLRLEELSDTFTQQQQQQQQDGAPPGGACHRHMRFAELSNPSGAPIMPWTLHRCLDLLQDSQGGRGFEAWLDTEPASSSLNLAPGAWAAAEAVAQTAGGDGSGTLAQADAQQLLGQVLCGVHAWEQAGWDKSAVLLQGRALRQLRVQGGDIAARLA